MSSDIFLVIALAVLVAMMFMNSRKRKKQVTDLLDSIQVGANVMLHSGIVGKITKIEGDRIELESTPGTKLRAVKQAVRSLDTAVPAVKAASTSSAKPAAKPATKAVASKKPAAKPAAKTTKK